MEEKKETNHWESAIQHIEQYVAVKSKLYKFELIERLARIESSIISSIFIYLIIFFCAVFALIAGAYAIGEYTGHLYLGFISITLLLLIIGIIFYNRKTWLKKKFLDLIIREVFEK